MPPSFPILNRQAALTRQYTGPSNKQNDISSSQMEQKTIFHLLAARRWAKVQERERCVDKRELSEITASCPGRSRSYPARAGLCHRADPSFRLRASSPLPVANLGHSETLRREGQGQRKRAL